jgi:hypothetical protein
VAEGVELLGLGEQREGDRERVRTAEEQPKARMSKSGGGHMLGCLARTRNENVTAVYIIQILTSLGAPAKRWCT